ncbi:nucleoside-diphosphate sugar epimerase/dehydratase [Capnocytophaga sp. oral taxon 903]|uniref:nucleoside-diphosphate sugar epimerase/dehydratase n=1 Tax=Capnocytophaga sp. oral taxon 903 TaxID=2748317 RepID=UPI0015B8E8CD|nr:nucleoside-diphosphate sugar epimerase/dehydratase [Capnocytophaga sp. oral taxon 903]NWO29013.1 polysaccharide biosynthesis protein [Capnocytophaga sp. oral taxon 903]
MPQAHNTYSDSTLVNLATARYTPRWIVVCMEVLLLFIALFFSFFVVERLGVYIPDSIPLYKRYLLVIGVNIFFMFIFRTYSGIIRYSTFRDLFRILLSSGCTVIAMFIANKISLHVIGEKVLLNPILLIYFTVSFIILFVFRLSVKEFFYLVKEINRRTSKRRILILGVDDEAVAFANGIIGNAVIPYSVVGFLTGRTNPKQATLLGRPIISKDKFIDTPCEELEADGVLINKNHLSKEEITFWVNVCLEKDLQILKTPALQKLRPEKEGFNLHKIQIEDLLGRRQIVLDNEEVRKKHYHKNILVTGGAGSIGSELIRQIATFTPALVVVLDQAETPLYDIELELKESFPDIAFEFVLADITNRERLESVFKAHKFSVVYHAAAYKHVPMIEENPHEAALVNIQGTKNVALLANKYEVPHFVMISTDKAVNPTNVMGASKRVAELFVQALQNKEGNKTTFITTRFGNVLGSNGSVIPHFRKQIEKGGPVTITHPDIVRYFMTITEACELVLQAGTMGKGGEIFVFDMGEPVKILNLATRMIKLSGFEPNVDIKLVYTGLRPGEKLYEELLSDSTKTMPTHHKKIMISKDPSMSFTEIEALTVQMYEVATQGDKTEVVRLLKQIVKEFKSNNSEYETLDKKIE